jgi:UDP:flavonoid glycosyltransferase YjiC (YdhE family)
MAVRSEEAARAFLRHRLLQLRSRELAEGAIHSVSFGKDDRLEIDFGADAPDEVESILREDRYLNLERSAPPIGVGATPPPLQIAILVTGTRGDVQPFIPIGQRLLRDGHRVRLATHAVFRDFVESNGLEFYPLGGDPKALIAYMVKTGGALLPSHFNEIVEDVPEKRKMLEEIIESCWGACTAADPGSEGAAPFKADAIIGNPPCYGHAHVAEKLRVPLHMMFTVPWTPTTAFPQPLSNLAPGRHPSRLNWLSYFAVDLLTWAGIGDIINRFRERTLGLPRLRVAAEGANVINDRAVPFTYLWSPALIPKPGDWHDNVDIADFIFFEQQSRFEPSPELITFIEGGAPPIYVGFGSCVVENPAELTRIIFAALEAAGVRGIVSAGWAGLGGGEAPPNVYLVGECAHDWLFPRCAAVCHHGGAGTTAAGLRCDRPTVIVPFFGDQPFWGQIVAAAGAGPDPVPIRELSVERLAAAFRACARPEVCARAAEIGTVLRSRDGADLAVEAFYRHLPDTASGALSCLGFGAAERARLANAEIVIVAPAQQRGAVSLSAAGRMACSLDRFCDIVASGRMLEADPGAVAWGHINDDRRAEDFVRAGLQPDQRAEVDALLWLKPGDTYNFSHQEIERFATARSRLGNNCSPEATREAVNGVLRGILFERMCAYREGGLDAIAPYARAGQRRTSPVDQLRASSLSDSLFATEFRDLYEVFMGFPKVTSPDAFHRFSWIERRSAEGPYFLLEHRMLARYTDFAVVAVRHFYATRYYDALSLTVGALGEGDKTLAMATWRFAAERLTGIRGFVRRPGTRRRVSEVLVEHVTAIRAAVEADDVSSTSPLRPSCDSRNRN